MVNYQCPTCFKEFSKKDNFIKHTEKKKNPCQPITPVQHQKPPENTEKSFNCLYCDLVFSRKDALTRHINQNRCKVKVELNVEKEKMFKLLLEQKEEEIKEKDERLVKLESMIKEQNDKITELIKKIKPSSITNNNTLNNIVIKPSMNKFGEEQIEKLLNRKQFEDKVLLLTGSNAFEACAEMIYNNPKYPENQTVFCTDLSREKFMVYNGDDWVLNTRNEVFTEVQNKIQEYIDMHEEELQDKLKNSSFKEKFYNRIGKFYKKYYGNKNEKDPSFENKTDEQLMRFFYKIKEFVKNNYNIMYNKQLELESKKVIAIEDKKEEPSKKRGRPKKTICV
jgi:hypothetical protein